MFEELVPLAAIVFVFGIPLIAILTSHQRKMAELMQRNFSSERENLLAQEVAALRDRVNQQTMMLEQLSDRMLTLPQASPPPLQERLEDRG